MYRTLNLFLAIVAMFAAAHLSAQTNSVSLKDGTGNVISQHNSITSAYAAIPATLTQAYLIELDTSYKGTNETYPITFVNKAGASSVNTITIAPSIPRRPLNINPGVTSSLFIFDNANWVILDGRQEDYYGLRYSHYFPAQPSIQFINGSANNVVRRFMLSSTSAPAIPAILFGASPIVTSGNSENLIEKNIIFDYKIAIASEGSVNNPNKRLVIQKNAISMVTNHAIKISSGTGRVTIDSNDISTAYDTTFCAYIMTQGYNDSIFVTRNIITLRSYNDRAVKPHQPCRGMYFEAGSSGGYFSIANNFINREVRIDAFEDSTMSTIDFHPNMGGIEFGGANPIMAYVYFNTVRMRSTLNDQVTAPGNIASAAFIRSETNAGSTYYIRNNLFLNSRIGGISGTKHLALRLSSINGLNMNYNTGTSSPGSFAAIGNTDYPSLSAYKAAFSGGNEADADSMEVSFISENGLHLASNMYGNTRMYGTQTGITTDFENHSRTNNYRGADEFVISCGSMSPGVIYPSPYFGCLNATTKLLLFGHTEANGMHYQWQYRPVGTTAFIDIPNATSTHLIVRFSDSTEYRVKDSCISGAPAVYSDTLMIAASTPFADSIIAVRNGATYTLYLAGKRNVGSITWHLGNGFTRTGDTVTYTYNQTGSFTVSAIMRTNFCFDTVKTSIDVDLSVDDIAGRHSLSIYPNPAQDHIQIDINTPVSYIITDLSGRHIQAGETQTGNLSIGFLAPGNYILTITDNKGTKQYGRFVKE